MTLSDEHENIIDDFRDCVNLFNGKHSKEFAKDDPENWLDGWTVFTIEHIVASVIYPSLKYSRFIADGYIQPPDIHSVFPLEVGRMKDYKWSNWIDAADEKPIRVLRISFEKNIYVLNPRDTKWERLFLRFARNNGFL